jgi:hypothetical protein
LVEERLSPHFFGSGNENLQPEGNGSKCAKVLHMWPLEAQRGLKNIRGKAGERGNRKILPPDQPLPATNIGTMLM